MNDLSTWEKVRHDVDQLVKVCELAETHRDKEFWLEALHNWAGHLIADLGRVRIKDVPTAGFE